MLRVLGKFAKFRTVRHCAMDAQMNSIIKLAEELKVDKGDLDQKLPLLLEQLSKLSTSMFSENKSQIFIQKFRSSGRAKKEKVE